MFPDGHSSKCDGFGDLTRTSIFNMACRLASASSNPRIDDGPLRHWFIWNTALLNSVEHIAGRKLCAVLHSPSCSPRTRAKIPTMVTYAVEEMESLPYHPRCVYVCVRQRETARACGFLLNFRTSSSIFMELDPNSLALMRSTSVLHNTNMATLRISEYGATLAPVDTET